MRLGKVVSLAENLVFQVLLFQNVFFFPANSYCRPKERFAKGYFNIIA